MRSFTEWKNLFSEEHWTKLRAGSTSEAKSVQRWTKVFSVIQNENTRAMLERELEAFAKAEGLIQ